MKKLCVLFLAVFLAGCAYKAQPIHNVEGRPLPIGARQWSMAEIQSTIIDAGQALNWRFEVLAPGRLRATQDQSKHVATVEITFDQSKYNMMLVSSRGLNEQSDRIHSRYNVWARNLQKNIDTWLTAASRR